MNCRDVERDLDRYLDGELPRGEREAIAAHLGECLSCRRDHRDLAALLARAGDLPAAIAPRRDLWPGIEARLRASAPPPAARARRVWLPLAAAAVLALAVGLPWLGRRGAGEAPAPAVPAVAATRAPEIPGSEIARAEDGTQQTRTDVLSMLARQRDQLSPETVAVIEENMTIIDDAIAQIRAALDEDPMSRELNHLLAQQYQLEAELLTRVNKI